MPKTVITLPCTAQDLESALHAVCDHHGLWNGRIDTMCDGSDSGDACVSIVLSEEVSGESSPSPSTPAPTNSAETRKMLDSIVQTVSMIAYTAGIGSKIAGMATQIIDEITAALNKPLRNCDLYGGDYKMLHTAWFDWTGSPSGQNPDGTAKMVFGEWLLAPAIKKGGAK